MNSMPAKTRRTGTDATTSLIMVLLGLATLAVTGWSMTTLLHDVAGAPWWVAGLGVGVFDLLALQAALLVKARHGQPWKAAGAQLVMIVAVAVSAAVNGFHGWQLGGWPVAVVLGAAPMSFEVAFAIKHRTLTVLAWLLFGKQTMRRLREDTWVTVAHPVPDSGIRIPAQVPDSARVPVEVPEPKFRIPELAPAQATADVQIGFRIPEPTQGQAESGFRNPGGIRNQVERLYESGTTDPDRIAAELSGVKSETVRRYVRDLRAAR